MRIVDSFDLPEAVVAAIANDRYDVGKPLPGTVGIFSPSSMLTPPQIRHLYRVHDDEIEEEAVSRWWALLGSAVHEILDRAAEGSDTELAEERFFSKLEVEGREWTISGMLDNLTKTKMMLDDYKVTSSWVVVNGGRDEWNWQLNVYAWLARQNGIEINQLTINALLRDWSWAQAMKSESYPNAPIVRIPIKVYSDAVIEAWMRARIQAHTMEQVPDCTLEEQWAKPSTYVIRKVGSKRAIRVMKSLQDLAHYADDKDLVVMDHGHKSRFGTNEQDFDGDQKKGDHYVVERVGEKVRCERYCSVAQFCPQADREGTTPTLKAFGRK